MPSVKLITNAAQRRDPTRTSSLRHAYANEFKRRWGAVKREVQAKLIQDDALGLRGGGFLSPAQRTSSFSTWLNLTITRQVSRDWQHTFLRNGYRRGVAQADADLEAAYRKAKQTYAGIDQASIFQQTIHAGEIALTEAKYDSDLENIQSAVIAQASRKATEALSQGWTPEDTYTAVADRVDKIGNTRSRVLALTAIIDAFALGSLNRLSQVGIQRVSIIPEVIFTTAGDGQVCEFCREEAGRVYNIFEAKGVIPLHGGCRCRWTLDLGFLLAQLGLIDVLDGNR